MRRFLFLLLLAGIAPVAAQAPISQQIPYQGFLTQNDVPVTDPALPVRFDLADDQGGTVTEAATVAVRDGVFSFRLGSTADLSALDFSRPLSLTLTVDPEGAAEAIGPVPLGAVPAAHHALAGGDGGGEPAEPFALPFSGSANSVASVFEVTNTGSGDGVRVSAAGTDGVEVVSATNGFYSLSVSGRAFYAGAAGETGLFVGYAGEEGVRVNRTGGGGVHLVTVGDGTNDGVPDDYTAHAFRADFVGGSALLANATGSHGLYIGRTGDVDGDGDLENSAADGLHIAQASQHGVYVAEAGDRGVSVGQTGSDGLFVGVAGRDGASVLFSGRHGMNVGSAGDADGDGTFENTDADGLHVTGAGRSGVWVEDALSNGVLVNRAGASGYAAIAPTLDGLNVVGAGRYGVNATGAGGNRLTSSDTHKPDLTLGTGYLSSSQASPGDRLYLRSNSDVTVRLNGDDSPGETSFRVTSTVPRFGFSTRIRTLFRVDASLPGAPAPLTGEMEIPAVRIAGTVGSADAGLLIDHPVNPAGQVLQHAAVQSDQRLVSYSGTVPLDAGGEAVVTLPEYASALMTDPRIQLTAIGAPMPNLHLGAESGGALIILGGAPGAQVSWRVEGVRQDAWAVQNPLVVEQAKSGALAGRYLYPTAFGLDPDLGEAEPDEPGSLAPTPVSAPESVRLGPEAEEVAARQRDEAQRREAEAIRQRVEREAQAAREAAAREATRHDR